MRSPMFHVWGKTGPAKMVIVVCSGPTKEVALGKFDAKKEINNQLRLVDVLPDGQHPRL